MTTQTAEQLTSSVALKHRWKKKPNPPDSYWEERVCEICKLEDMRSRDRTGPRKDWGVTTPCIDPVPLEVSYEAFMRELKEHNVRYNVLCIGVPGNWQVGFSIGDQGSRVHNTQRKGFRTLEQGFASLLQWTRARQYNPEMYSDIRYLDGLYRDHGCCCCDDD